MSFAIQSYFDQTFLYSRYNKNTNQNGAEQNRGFIEKISSDSVSSEKIEKAGVMTMDNSSFLSKYANILSANDVNYEVDNKSVIDVENFKEVETAKYKLVPESDIGGIRIFVNGESAGVFKARDLKIQEDVETGTKVIVGELPGFGSAWYDVVPVDNELENALSEAMGVDEVPHQELENYYIGTHNETGIKYLMRPGDEGKGGRVLLCNPSDEAKYKALGEEYAREYPNLIKSAEEGLAYASFEIRGMAHRCANGIVMTHPDNISYRDNDDITKNWSAKIDENTWNTLLSWLKDHTLNSEEMSRFKYWDGIFDEIGGKYERVWSDDELRQGCLYQ